MLWLCLTCGTRYAVGLVRCPNDGSTEYEVYGVDDDDGGDPELTVLARLAALETAAEDVAVSFSVRSFGAVGDGSTNDTAAIQAAIDALPASGGELFFPGGTYLVPNGGLVADNVVRLHGIPGLDGSGSRIRMTASSGTLLEVNGSGSVVQDLIFTHPKTGTRNTDLIGVEFNTANTSRIESCTIEGFSTNLAMRNGVYHQTVKCLLRAAARVGMEIVNDVNGDAGDMTVLGCTFDKGGDSVAGGTALLWRSGGGLRYIDNKVIGNGVDAPFEHGLRLAVDEHNATGVLVVVGNSFENYSGEAIAAFLADPEAGGLFGSSLLISANEIASYRGGYVDGVASMGIRLDLACQSVAITGNTFHDMAYGIDIDQVSSVTIAGNAMNAIGTLGIRIRSEASWVHLAPQAIGALEGSTEVQVDEGALLAPTAVHTTLTAAGAIVAADDIRIASGKQLKLKGTDSAHYLEYNAANVDGPTISGWDGIGLRLAEVDEVRSIRFGTGSPNGNRSGNPGDLCLSTDGLYVKTSGTGNTGWQKLAFV